MAANDPRTVFWSPIPYLSVFNVWWVGTLPLIYWLYTLTSSRERMLPVLSLGILIMGCGLAGYALVQHFIYQEAPRSVFININLHAALLNLIAISLTAYLFQQSNDSSVKAIYKYLLWIALFVLVYAVALTNSRGATVSLIASLLILSILSWWFVHKKIIASVVILVATALQ